MGRTCVTCGRWFDIGSYKYTTCKECRYRPSVVRVATAPTLVYSPPPAVVTTTTAPVYVAPPPTTTYTTTTYAQPAPPPVSYTTTTYGAAPMMAPPMMAPPMMAPPPVQYQQTTTTAVDPYTGMPIGAPMAYGAPAPSPYPPPFY